MIRGTDATPHRTSCLMTSALKATFELAALRRHFNGFFSIEQNADGEFHTRTPGLVDGQGNIWGTTGRSFSSWDDAKRHLLSAFRRNERPSQENLLAVSLGDRERIVFSTFDSYNPVSAPSEEAYPIPEKIRELMGMDDPGNKLLMHARTINKPGWSGDIFAIVKKHAERSGLMHELGITDFKTLTPRQAIDLTSRTVLELTKYRYDTRHDTDGKNAIDLLQEGMDNHSDPAWKGCGVCRHFASTMKCVYDAIKINQAPFSQLHNTYCMMDVEMESASGASYEPRRPKSMLTMEDVTRKYPGHAWNKFITITQSGDADVTIADITWADRESPSRDKIRDIDFTQVRMEPLVRKIAEAGNGAGNIDPILAYYTRAIQNPEYPEDTKTAFATNAVSTLLRSGVPRSVPQGFAKAVIGQFTGLADKASTLEIETLDKISALDPFTDFDTLLTSYVDARKKTLPSGALRADGLLFHRSDDLQRRVFEKLKSIPDFQQKAEKSPMLYKRLMDVYPTLSRDFSPATNALHGKILVAQINGSKHLSAINREHDFVFCDVPPDEDNPLDAAGIRNLIAEARKGLHDSGADIPDYMLLSRYDALHEEAKSGRNPGPSPSATGPSRRENP